MNHLAKIAMLLLLAVGCAQGEEVDVIPGAPPADVMPASCQRLAALDLWCSFNHMPETAYHCPAAEPVVGDCVRPENQGDDAMAGWCCVAPAEVPPVVVTP